PTDYSPGLFLPAPANGPYATNLAVFNGADPNGAWKLYVFDNVALDGGGITNWILNLDWEIRTLVLRNPARLTNGDFQFEIVGRTGFQTIIQRSSNLTAWVPVATNIYSTNPGVFRDPAPLAPYRSYRAVQP